MNRFRIFILLALTLACGTLQAAPKRPAKGKKAVAAAPAVPKKSPYEKFIAKKGMK